MGALLCCSILPPTCSRNVRSVVSTTRAASIASMAATISSQCSGPLASTVLSRSGCASATCPRSSEPIVPPAAPMALATCPSIPGLWAISTRMVSENWAGGVAATGLTLLGRETGRAQARLAVPAGARQRLGREPMGLAPALPGGCAAAERRAAAGAYSLGRGRRRASRRAVLDRWQLARLPGVLRAARVHRHEHRVPHQRDLRLRVDARQAADRQRRQAG